MKRIEYNPDKPVKKDRLHHKIVRHGGHHIRRRPYLLPIFGFALGLLIVAGVLLSHGGRPLQASELHIVYLFDKGQQQTLDTKAKTVGELVKKLPLHLAQGDVVEPSTNTKIVEDNFRINIYRARPVAVLDSDKRTITVTAQRSARVVAQEAGLRIYAEDRPVFAQGTLRENIIGEKVVIDRATPMYLNLYGTALDVRTQAQTVGELIKEKNIKLEATDVVKPGLETPIDAKLQVFITRKGTKIVTKKEKVPAPTQIVKDKNLSLGASAVRQEGSDGQKAVTYMIITKNGKEVGRKVIQQVIVQEPVPNIIARGTRVFVNGDKTAWMAAAGIPGSDYGYVNYVISHESNWNPAALNAGGCAGLGQACPGSKLAYACPNWQTDPVCQLGFFDSYAVGRYGSWSSAYNHKVSYGWW